ncbi:hypothetical protein [Streptomyces sp. NPDC051677]|uniref:hypothetical protein n=1 Tax=Streptomyces sp. NPDC051677 TaxID=3365669 RepID=UPI0037CDDA07
MYDVEIIVDEKAVPPGAVYLSLSTDEKTLRATVSPRIGSAILAALAPELGNAIASAVEGHQR